MKSSYQKDMIYNHFHPSLMRESYKICIQEELFWRKKMARKKKVDLHNLYNEFKVEEDLVNLLAFNYKKIQSMNTDELAFEYLRRNPKFIKDFLDDMSNIQETDKLIKYKVEMKHYYQKEYLYNPIDIYGIFNSIEEKDINHQIKLLKDKYKNYQYSFEEFIKSGQTRKSRYINLYNTDINIQKIADIDAYRNKQNNPINMEELFKPVESKRWLNWLRPSINLEINPNKNKEELKEAFQKLLTLFDENESLSKVNHISAPNYLIDYFDIESFKDESLSTDIKSPRNSAEKLFWYDVKYIFTAQTDFFFSKLQEVYELAFPDNNDFGEYIDIHNTSDDVDKNSYKLKFTKKANMSVKEAQQYIYGGYLKLLYPKVSIEKHFFAIKDILEVQMQTNNTGYKNIIELSDSEYEKLNNDLLHRSFDERMKIVKYILRTPLDIIDEINT